MEENETMATDDVTMWKDGLETNRVGPATIFQH